MIRSLIHRGPVPAIVTLQGILLMVLLVALCAVAWYRHGRAIIAAADAELQRLRRVHEQSGTHDWQQEARNV